MCGIVGFFEQGGADRLLKLDSMSARLKLRGPDDTGSWVCPDSGMALAHRRLAILDLSPLGAQPMHSNSGRYVIVFNGEVYNFRQLQPELAALGHTFRGGSDTEVMLAAIEEWGLKAAVTRFVGMFAFALWDRHERALHLVRDRLGKKPLYYGWNRGVFYFASELKALFAHPHFNFQIDRQALAMMLRYGYVPAPRAILKGIHKANPGTIRTISMAQLEESTGEGYEQAFWSSDLLVDIHDHELYQNGDNEILASFNTLLRDAVKIRMIADVPIGAFLSGGIDSSLVASVMQELSDRPIKTFSIGFHEDGYNEAPFAAKVAKQIGSDHCEVYLSARDALDVVPKMAEVFDEPFADQSQIPTFLVSQIAKRSVTVALSGDGGDELFAGYARYRQTELVWNVLQVLPSPLRAMIGKLIRRIPEPGWDALFRVLHGIAPQLVLSKGVGAKIDRLSHVLALKCFDQLYQRALSFHEDGMQLVKGERAKGLDEICTIPQGIDTLKKVERLMLLDLKNYLVDDILVKVDRASMAASLEARAPLLDHRLVEFAWRVPFHLKSQHGKTKVLLRQALRQRMPEELFDRPKMGFGIPAPRWMRHELREWCDQLLQPGKLAEHDLLDAGLISNLWSDFLSGREIYAGLIWNIVMFQSWYSELNRGRHV